MACSGESHPEKVKVKVEPENDVNPKQAEIEVEILEDPEIIEKNSAAGIDEFMAHYTEVYDIIENTKPLLLDRFTSEKAFKKSIKRKQEVLMKDSTVLMPVGDVWHYEYQDSAQLANVLRNWFLEFGHDRSEVMLGENKKVDSESGIFIIDENTIDVFYGDCKLYNTFSWNDIGTSFRRALVSKNSTVFRVDCDGELIWEQYSLPKKEVEETEANQDTDENVGENESP